MVVVMDSKSGEVLAMANVRRDPVTGAAAVSSANHALVDAYEPGSVAKLITASAALEEGVIDTERHMEVPGQIRMYDFDFTDAWPHPTEWWGIRDIVRLSSNIGTIFLARDLGPERMEQYMHAFGVGVDTGLGFPGETAGILKPADQLQGSEKVTLSYGQGVGTTSVQLAAAVNTIANGGVYVAPSLVKATVDGKGDLQPAPPAATRQVLRPQVTATMTEILRSVVCAGTAKLAKVPGYAVAGKTGTAYKAQGDGYEGAGGRKYVASFAGFVPAEAPRLSINVSIDEPVGSHYGGSVAAPLFSQVAQEALRLQEVPPSPDGGTCPNDPAPSA
jgi:cell division protein FtsI (penicillin-binding protein 3)